MGLRRWDCVWGSERIVVELDEGAASGRRLFVNGTLVDEEPSFKAGRAPPYLCAKVQVGSSVHVIEADLGPARGALICQIFVDGEQVGGDRGVSQLIPTPLFWGQLRARGRARFLARQLARRSYFILAGALGAYVVGRGSRRWSITALVAGCASALANAEALWNVAERRYQRRLEKLGDPAFVGAIRAVPRVVSLVLIAFGVLLLLLVVIALAAMVTAWRDGQLPFPWLLLPFAVLALPISILFAARALRRARK